MAPELPFKLGTRRGRNRNMKTKLFTLVLLAGGSLFAESHWSIGIGIGAP